MDKIVANGYCVKCGKYTSTFVKGTYVKVVVNKEKGEKYIELTCGDCVRKKFYLS